MSNLAQILLAGLGGGFGQLGDYLRQQQVLKQQREMADAQHALDQGRLDEDKTYHAGLLAGNQAMLNQNAEQFRVREHNDAIKDFITNSDNLGIGYMNPTQAYDQMNPQFAPSSDGALNALGIAMGQAQPLATKDFMDRAGQATRQAQQGNLPRAPIAGSEGMGGAFAVNKTFNPFQGLYNSQRIGMQERGQMQQAVSQAMTRIKTAYMDAFNSFRSTPAYNAIALKYGEGAEQTRRAAEQVARDRVAQQAQAELNVLQSMYPELSTLTTDAMLGFGPIGKSAGPLPGAAPRRNVLIPDTTATPPARKPNVLLPPGAR